MPEQKFIEIRGAREHNLKSIDIDIPRDKLVVITGLSGSGKSSLAFDTIYAEGQRRYVESLSAYARQFLDMMQKPDVDHITGLSPAISIEQKTTSKNPRSTVGTVTEIYDYLRLLFARVGTPYSPATGLPIEAQQVSQMVDITMALPEGTRAYLLAPIVRDRKGEYRKEFADLRKQGFQRVKVNGAFHELDAPPELDKKYRHNIDVVVDRVVVREGLETRLADSLRTALDLADGIAILEIAPPAGEEVEGEEPQRITFSEKFACPVSGFTIAEIEPRLFSFNAPFGACPACDGLGVELFFDPRLIVPDEGLTLMRGAIAPWAKGQSPYYKQTIEALANHYGFDRTKRWRDLPDQAQNVLLYGSDGEKIRFRYDEGGRVYEISRPFEGVIPNMERRYRETDSAWSREEMERYQNNRPCGTCHGFRLKPEALAVKIAGSHVGEVVRLSIREALAWIEAAPAALSAQKNEIARAILKEIRERLGFLVNVGLDYLTLARNAGTLSGGESQRIRLASQIGSGLTGVLYVLDEPSIGLHQRDNDRLLTTLKNLRDAGNTVIVVEHDEEAIREADHVIDIGPGAGVHGGAIIAEGTPADIAAAPDSITGQYLTGARRIEIPAERRKGNGRKVVVRGATGNNLQNVTAAFPLGTFTCVTGVSGGGKSTLTIETLFKTASMRLNGARQTPAPCETIEGLEYPRQGHRHRPVADRPHPALEPRHLHRRLRPDPRLVCRPPRGQGPRLQAGALQLQRQGRPLRGLPGRRRHQDRDALPAGRLRHLRDLQGQALQPRDPGSSLQGQEHRRRARHDGGGRRGVLRRGAGDPREDDHADAGGLGLRQGRPAGDDALGRRGAAGEALQGAGPPLDRAHPLHPRRADHRPPLRGHPQAPRGAARAGRPGQHRRGDRAQPRRHQDRRPHHRHRSRRWRRRRHHRRHRHPGGDRPRRRQLHRPLPRRAAFGAQGGGGIGEDGGTTSAGARIAAWK